MWVGKLIFNIYQKRIKRVAKSSKSCFVVQRIKDSAVGFGLNPTI
jgi:hypothetical protein